MIGREQQVSVLVVDDFAAMRKTVRDSLKLMGIKDVVLAESGAEAVKVLTSRPIDLIVSDWNMPEMDGLALLRHVRNTPKLRGIPFMLVTAEGERAAVNTAIEEGVSQFLIKPFTQAALQTKIRQMISRVPNKAGNRIPVPVRAGGTQASARITFETEGATVLVVDDMPSNIDVISGILKRLYRVKAATNGQKALAIAKAPPEPDLILLDIMMPGMDGFEVCRKLKEDPETASIPVIFLTAKSETADVLSGFEVGGVDYLVKPAEPAILEARAATHIRLKRARDDMRNHVDTLLENARLREDVERITRHDIKSPLAAIVTTSDMLLQRAPADADSRSDLETIRESAYDALGMVNRSLDLYKMEMGTYPVRTDPVDIADVADKVVKEARVNAHKETKMILLDAPDTCVASGEETLCLSLLRNLVKNAVEASPDREKVAVTVTTTSNVVITVHNQGVVPESIRENFFDKYATAGKAGGTGLGTYSAALMTRVQGGQIDFVTSETEGTTVTVELPRYEAGTDRNH